MGSDLQKNIRWMEKQLLAQEEPRYSATEAELLMQQADALIGQPAPEDVPMGNFSRKSKGARAEQAHTLQQFDESAAVLTKTKKELLREAKRQKSAEKKAAVNRNTKGLVFLAFLECMGILAILGWWLQ